MNTISGVSAWRATACCMLAVVLSLTAWTIAVSRSDSGRQTGKPARTAKAEMAKTPMPNGDPNALASSPSPTPSTDAEHATHVTAVAEPVRSTPSQVPAVPPQNDLEREAALQSHQRDAAEHVAIPPVPPTSGAVLHYPIGAFRSHTAGVVGLDVKVDVSGRPISVRVAKSSGVRELDDAAVSDVYEWNFTPAKDTQGRPVVGAASVTAEYKR